MNTDQTEKLAGMSDADLKEQTEAQYRAVAHMAKALAEVHEPHMIAKAFRAVLELQCVRSAKIMEMLGDTLNATDAVDSKKDYWMGPIFEKARSFWAERKR